MNQTDKENDGLWKWGFIYYNPNDRKSVVTKRYGLGWTFNFARPLAYVWLLLIAAVTIGIRFLIKK